MTRAWRGLAAWSVMGYAWAGTPLWADPPDADAVMEIEQYHGVKRVDQFRPPAPPRVEARPMIEAPKALPVVAPTPIILPTIEPVHHLVVHCASEPGPAKEIRHVEYAAPLRPAETETKFVPAPSAAPKPEAERKPKAPAETILEIRPRFVQAELPQVIVHAPPAAREDGTLTVVSNVVRTIVTPLAMLAGIWSVVRYLQGRSGPLIRIEHVGAVYAAPAAPAVNAAPLEPSAVDLAAAAPVEETSTAETFELGPTFEEQRLARQQQALQQEEGVLRQLFDDNVKLQKQLKEVHAEWSEEAGADAESSPAPESQVVLT